MAGYYDDGIVEIQKILQNNFKMFKDNVLMSVNLSFCLVVNERNCMRCIVKNASTVNCLNKITAD